MNKCYIISFEISTNTDVTGLITAIRGYDTWAKITETTWAVVTEQTAAEVRNNLTTHIGQGRLFVVKSGIEAAWINVICRNEWLKNNL